MSDVLIRGTLATALIVAVCLPCITAAQATTSDSIAAVTPADVVAEPAVVPMLSVAPTSLVTRRTMTWMGIGALVTTTALMPFDARIAHQVRESRGAGGGIPDHVASALNSLGDPGTVVIPVSLLAIGFVGRNETMRDVGWHATQAVVLSGAITALLKDVAGRSRPSSPGPVDADDFAFARGARGSQGSFPSGHTTAAFALATILVSETHRLRPGATMITGIAAYSIASGVGFARIYTNRHWPSDVVLGAGIGTLTALAIDRMAHSRPGAVASAARFIPRATLALGGEGRGTNVMWSVPLPR